MTPTAGSSMGAVLITDVVGSTELMARLGDTAFDSVRAEHFAALGEVVVARAGVEVKTTGDGILATFTSAVDALAAAVAAQQAVDRQSRASEIPVAIRVGLAIGEVAFDEAGDVFGTPVVEAARLMSAARGGQILCSALVRAMAGSRAGVTFTDLGPLDLKGLPDPVPACEVAWEPLAEPAAAVVSLPSVVTGGGRIFVGREDELARLHQWWKEARAGACRLVLVGGEPGVGKTRLATALAQELHAEGALVLAGRCEEDLGVPYQPFVEALRHHVTHASAPRLGRHAGELPRLVPELAQLVPGLPEPLHSDPETERYRLFDAVAAWLHAVSAETPVLLVVDDLHWAAKPTFLLMRHVLRSPERSRLLIVATYRDTEVGRGHPLAELLADVPRLEEVERLLLSGLNVPAVVAFVEEAAGHSLDEEGVGLAQAVWRETEGNAFFVSEVLRHLSESGAITRQDGRWVLTADIRDLGIPAGVRDVVGRRLSRLSEEANRVLAVASVVGIEFEPAVVQAAGGLDEDAVLAALEEAAAARLLAEVPGPILRNRFSHTLVRTTLYEELSAARRATLHRKVAEALEALHARNLDDHLPALAHHWSRAGAPAAETARAVEYAARAGDRALAQLAHDEAAGYYLQAIGLLDAVEGGGDEAGRLELLLSLGEAQRRAGDPAYRDTLLDAARLAKERDDADALVRAALANSRGYFSVAGRVDAERVEVLEAALGVVGPDDSPRRARLLANLAVELVWAPQQERRDWLTTEALSMARRMADSDPATLGHVLAMRYTPTGPADLHDDLADLAGVAARLDDPALAFWAANWSAQNALVIGDRAGFDAALDASARLAAELRQPALRWAVAFVRSTQSRIAGRLADAEAHARESFELGQGAGIPDSFRVYGVQLLWIRYDQGRLDEVIDLLTHAAARPNPDPLTLAALALTLVELDRLDEARHVLDNLAAEGFATLPSSYARLYALTIVAEACAGVGDPAQAAILHDRLAPYAGLVGTVWSGASGCVDHYLGLLAVTMGHLDGADARFAAAEALHRRVRAPTWLARTHLEWAKMLLGRQRPGDGERARELLDQALTTARELGLGGVERQAVALLR